MAAIAPAASPRADLVQAAFGTTSKAAALALIDRAANTAKAELARHSGDREALLQSALAIGYRAKLNRAIGDAKDAHKRFDQIVIANPRDPEALVALAGWHLEAISDIGATIAGMMLGANRKQGFALLDRAVALGNGAPLYGTYAALLRIRIDPRDVATARALAERAAAGPVATPLDRIMVQNATALLVPLRAGDGRAASELAKRLLPFGKLEK